MLNYLYFILQSKWICVHYEVNSFRLCSIGAFTSCWCIPGWRGRRLPVHQSSHGGDHWRFRRLLLADQIFCQSVPGQVWRLPPPPGEFSLNGGFGVWDVSSDVSFCLWLWLQPKSLEHYLSQEEPRLLSHLRAVGALPQLPYGLWFRRCFAGCLPESSLQRSLNSDFRSFQISL